MASMAAAGAGRPAKAVGTRDRVVHWLAANGDLHDASGMASGILAREIGYPGTSIAFAQLLSGMERSGLISREIRGKRTYAVALSEAGRRRSEKPRAVPRRAVSHIPAHRAYPLAERPPAGGGPAGGAGVDASFIGDAANELDLDELATRLLVQVAHRLTGNPAQQGPSPQGLPPQGAGAEPGDLAQRVAALELELRASRDARLSLEEENHELRAQLERIRRNLEGDEPLRGRDQLAVAPDPVDRADIALLQRLLAERTGSRSDERGATGTV